jgi:hypothetical protein
MPDLLIASATSRVMLTAAGALSVASAGASRSGRVGSVMRVSMPLTTRELAHNAGPRRAGTFPGRSSIVEGQCAMRSARTSSPRSPSAPRPAARRAGPPEPDDPLLPPATRRWSPSSPTSPAVDILLGNLEDAIPADNKEAARRAREGRQGHRLR